jgi:hypothetical protein
LPHGQPILSFPETTAAKKVLTSDENREIGFVRVKPRQKLFTAIFRRYEVQILPKQNLGLISTIN